MTSIALLQAGTATVTGNALGGVEPSAGGQAALGNVTEYCTGIYSYWGGQAANCRIKTLNKRNINCFIHDVRPFIFINYYCLIYTVRTKLERKYSHEEQSDKIYHKWSVESKS